MPIDPPALHLDAYADVFETVREEILAFPDASRVPVTFDVLRAVTTVMGAAGTLATYRPALARLLDLDHARIDRLQAYAQAVEYAHTRWFASITPPPTVAKALADCKARRKSLLVAAAALVSAGLLPGDGVDRIRRTKGQSKLVVGVIGLVGIFRNAWETVGTRTAVTLDELALAERSGEALFAAIAARDSHASRDNEWADVRLRAVSLLVTTYDQFRRGMSFVRWAEGDVDELAPSVYNRSRRGAGKRKRGAKLSEAGTTKAPRKRRKR